MTSDKPFPSSDMNQLYVYLRLFSLKQALLWILPVLLSLWLSGAVRAQCPTIDKVTVSGCYYSAGQSLATVTVQVGFGSTGTGNITVTLRNANNAVLGTRTITPGNITVAYTGTISGVQTIVSPQVVAFDVPANGSTVTVTADRAGCGTANYGQAIQIPTNCAPTNCTGNALGGAVYFDFNANGVRESGETVGVAGITVTAYPKSGAPLSTTTDGFGQFSLSVPAASYPVRLEYTKIPTFLSGGRSGPNGSGSRTTVQFLSAPTCQANLGVLNQAEYCDVNPLVMTPCYVNGDPLVAGTAADDPAVVGLPYNSTGRAPAKTFMLPNSSLGATWATAYNKTTKRLFTSAVVRRHAGLGPLGLGGIYQIDLTSPTAPAVSNFLDVAANLGINVGSIPSNSARGLVGDKAAKSYDPASFSLIGKVGIGGMDFSDDNTKLYFTNIFDNTIYQIDMTAYNLGGPKPTAANVKSFPIPDPGCVGGTRRSWALKAYRGYVYAGVVCDASTTTKSNMVSYVYRLDPTTGTWTQIFSIPMTYPKGWAFNYNSTGWYAWSDNFNLIAAAPYSLAYHQPMFTDIEFDVDGSMVLGFGDRLGMQMSGEQYGPIVGNTTLYTVASGGDMLRAYFSNGTYILENNAKAGPATGYGANNNQGPGFGEFYNDNLTAANDGNYLGHAENALGGLALKPGSGEVVATIMDPINLPSTATAGDYVWANGVRRLSNSTGGVNDAFIVYQRYVNGTLVGPGTSGKATGLGDVELGCAQATYIELGNRIWKDANRNGVQDPSEQPLAGLQIQLYKGATLVASTTTNAGGEYYFSTLLGHDLKPNTTYNILFGTGQFNNATQELTVGPNKYKLTTPDAGQGSNADQNDSDADPNVLSTALGTRPAGVPQIVVTTGDYGYVDHSFDAGVYCSDIVASVTAVAATCNGSTNNNDGQVVIVSGANASRYAVSVGSSFTGVSFTAASPLTSFPVTVLTNAPNMGQVYTVRVFNGSDDCIQDVVVYVPQSCTINSCTAVGGTTVYSNTAILCTSSNAGSLTLTGQAGNVGRWQTSTDGGATWVDLPNTSGQATYNFVNAQNGQQFRAALNSATGCPDVFSTPVTLTTSSSACSTSNCDNRTGSFSVTTNGQPVSGQSTRLIAVDLTGVIRAVSPVNSTTLTNVPTGDYQAYQVSFDNAQAPTLSVGTSLSAVTGICVRLSNAVPLKVCSSTPTSLTLTGPAPGTTVASVTPAITGTATPGSIVTINGGPGSTGGPVSVTADSNGNFTTSAITFPNGPNSVTAVAYTPTGGNSTPVSSSFTVNGPPSLTVTPVTDPGPTTQPITGTATPGVPIVITNPAGQTLCTTTASSSGTFSCPVSLTTGVNNLTVTACNTSGCTSRPISRTALTAPTVSIDPVPTTASLTPTISGTATPGAYVDIIGPNNTTLCSAVASQLGNYSCGVTLLPGAQTLKAVATNPGGSATATTASFTVVGAPTLAVDPATNPGPATQPITGTATPGSQVIITDPTGATLCSTMASSSGTFSCPVSLTTGANNLLATACNVSGCTSQPTSRMVIAAPSIGVDPMPTTTSVTPTVSGTATPGALVSILGPNSSTLCSTTATSAGNYSCIVSVAPGPQTLTAVATNPGGSATATTTSFTATGVPSLTVAPPQPGPTTQPVTGTATPGSLVTITDPTGNTLCSTTASISGTFACPVSLTSGVNNLTVTACNTGGCASQPVTLTAVPAPTIAVNPMPTVTTTTPIVSGTATPGSLISLLGPGSTTLCSTTATQAGTYSCVVSVAPGLQTLTAVATNPGGSATATTTSFTATGVPSLTVDPPVVGPTTQPVTGTATPGSLVTITGPMGNTLCQTTASVSGTFSCPVSLTSGVNNLTVTACNGGGCTTQPVALTALALPTVAILSPANSTTQPATTNTISGTATPNTTVVLTTPTGSYTITPNPTTGAYLMTGLSFSTGVNNVTVTASNAGGTTTATSTFTVVNPASLTVAPMQPGPTTQPVTGTATPGSLVTITGPAGNTLCSTTASVSGTFACPVSLTSGVNKLTVTACSTGGCTSQPISATVVPPPSVAINGPSGTLTNTSPLVSGTATPGSVVSILGPGSTTLCSTTATQAGSYACVVNVALGPQTLTAVASNPGGTASATTSFTAGGLPTLVVDPGPVGPTVRPISLTTTPGSVVTITGPGPTTLCSATAGVSGTISCPVTLPTGVTTLTVTSCNAIGCTTKPLPVTAVAPPSLTAAQPVQPGPTSQPIAGTATPGSLVAITDPTGTTLCTTTASLSGTFSCPVSLTSGVNHLVVTACNQGGCTTRPVDVTAVDPPTLVVVPPVGGPTTQPITGTATPGSVVTITGPGPVTLCTTTASLSGTFSCPVSLPTGVTTLTITACNGGGCTTKPVTVTAVPMPGIAVSGPSGMVTGTTPTVSGTATPGSVVNILGPGSTTLCSTTATQTGSYSCTVSVPYGPVSLTATAMNLGGTASAVTSFTAVNLPQLIVDPIGPKDPTNPTVIITGTTDPGLPVTITDPTGATLCSTTATSSGTFSCSVTVPIGATGVTVTSCSPAGCTVKPVAVPLSLGLVKLNVRVLLQGALINVSSGSLMRDDLRAGGYLTTTTPYSAIVNARFTQSGGGGGETTSPAVLSGNAGTADAIVDWVLVELRSVTNPALIVATRSGLVQRDGDVVLPSDGVSPLSFTGLSGTQYFVSVKHRNHLGAMTATAIPLSATGTTVDFTTMASAQVYDKPSAVSYDGVEMVTINGKQALWAGDANADGKVKYIGSASDNSRILNDVISFQSASQNPAYNYDFAFGYFFGDVDLNGKAKYQGMVNDPTVIFNNVVALYPLNTSQLYNYDFLIEQLP